jgi:hypothetical protein
MLFLGAVSQCPEHQGLASSALLSGNIFFTILQLSLVAPMPAMPTPWRSKVGGLPSCFFQTPEGPIKGLQYARVQYQLFPAKWLTSVH